MRSWARRMSCSLSFTRGVPHRSDLSRGLQRWCLAITCSIPLRHRFPRATGTNSRAFVAVLVLSLASPAFAQSPDVSIFKLLGTSRAQTSDRVAAFVETLLRRTYGGAIEESNRPEVIHTRLAEVAARSPRTLIFVIGNRATVAELAIADARQPCSIGCSSTR